VSDPLVIDGVEVDWHRPDVQLLDKYLYLCGLREREAVERVADAEDFIDACDDATRWAFREPAWDLALRMAGHRIPGD
jgi:hypothetical protein